MIRKFKDFSNKEIYDYLNILEDIFAEIIDDSKNTHIYYNHQISYSHEEEAAEVESISVKKTSIYRFKSNNQKYLPHFTIELTIGRENLEAVNQSLSLISRVESEGLKLCVGNKKNRGLVQGHDPFSIIYGRSTHEEPPFSGWFSINVKNSILQKEDVDKIESLPEGDDVSIELRFINI